MKLLLLSFLLIVPTPLTFYAFVFLSSFFYIQSLFMDTDDQLHDQLH